MFKHILLPTDGSELSRDTAQRAVSFAKEASATITALYAKRTYRAESLNEGDLVEPAVLGALAGGSEEKAKESLRFVKKLCKDAGVPCTTIESISATPWEAIVNAADENGCDLIFMASHGHGVLRSRLLGSQTQSVLIHSDVPVLVYRPPRGNAARRKAKQKAKENTKTS